MTGLGLDPDRGDVRRAFVDGVSWAEVRGALRTAGGCRAAWARAPGAGEALYDVARDVVFALFRPSRVLQHVESVAALLDRSTASSGNAARRAAAQAARRAGVERPVVYFTDVEEPVANHLRGSALASDLQRLTGLRVERRAEGVVLVDTTTFSSERFPGTGSVAQVGVLLAVEMADRVVDPDGRRVRRLTPPDPREGQRTLIAAIAAGLPTATLVPLGGTDDEPPREEGEGGEDDPARLPFITDSFLRTAVGDILQRYATAFGAQWHADPDPLRVEAVALLERCGAGTEGLRQAQVAGGTLSLRSGRSHRTTPAQPVRQRRPDHEIQPALPGAGC